MSLTTAISLNLNEMLKVKANVVDAYGHSPTNDGYTITWSSSDASVAYVEPFADNHIIAFITGMSAGTATITAQVGSVSSTFSVYVVDQTGEATSAIVLEAFGSPARPGGPSGE